MLFHDFFLFSSELPIPFPRANGLFRPNRYISKNNFRRRTARADDELVHDEPHTTKTSEPLSIPSFPEISYEWGYTGTRYQGPNRAFSLRGASSYEEHINQSSDLPFPTETGHHISPSDLQEAISFITQRGNAGIKGFWLKQLSRIQQRAHELMPTLYQLGASADPSREPSRARLHVPLRKELLAENGMGGSEWRGKFVAGFPILGEIAEPGVFHPSKQPPSYVSQEEPFNKAAERFLSGNRTSDPNGNQLWFEAMEQVKKHWLDGPHRYSERGELIANDGPVLANPAFRCGIQQGPKLRAVDDLKKSAANDATFVSTPINSPSWNHKAQMRVPFHLKGGRRPLAMATADHADAYKQLPVSTKDEPAAAITLRHSVDGEGYGFIPHTQLFGSTLAVLHYNCLSRVIAALTCRALRTPHIVRYGEFGVISPESSIKTALDVFASFNKALLIILKGNKSEYGAPLELLG